MFNIMPYLNCSYLIKIIKFPFLIFLFYSCSFENQKVGTNDKNYLDFTDYYGRKVILKNEPQRIISISPGITEIIFSYNAENKLIACSEYCIYPDEALKLPKIGGISDANIEKILSYNPDLVIVSSIFSKNNVELLERGGVAVIALPERNTVDSLFHTLNIMGKILNKQIKSDSIIKSLKLELSNLKIKNKIHVNIPTVYYVIGFGDAGDFTAGRNTFINDMINIAGGKNIAEDLDNWTISREKLFKLNPEYIFIRNEDLNTFCKMFPYNNLSAVKNNKVYGINSIYIDIQGTMSIEGIKYINQKIHL